MIKRLGIGLYLGDECDSVDKQMLNVINAAVSEGINTFDCAPCYRNSKSEKLIGAFMRNNPNENLFVSTKGGFIPFDFSKGREQEEKYLQKLIHEQYIKEELLDRELFQTFDTAYLDYSLSESLKIIFPRTYYDVYYIHNPEYVLEKKGRDKYIEIMKEVLLWLKVKIDEGVIKSFGVSSWEGFFNKNETHRLQLDELVQLSFNIGIGHHFKYVQVPYNILETRALFSKSQNHKGIEKSLIRLAKELGISMVTSAPLAQGKINKIKFPNKLFSIFGPLTPAQMSMAFVLSTPGIECSLLGTSSVNHLNEIVEIIKKEKYGYEYFSKIL